MPVLDVRHLGKRYKRAERWAVKDLNLTVERGEAVGLLGPNGAGKSTTFKMIASLLSATSGDVIINGYESRRQRRDARAQVGYVAQTAMTFPEATVGAELTSQAELYGLARREARRESLRVLDMLGLRHTWSQTCASLSGGQRRRLDIAMALVHRPNLLLMDEPSTGLDISARLGLWDVLHSLSKDVAMLISTHYVEEAEHLCNRLVIINRGRKVADASPDALRSTSEESHYEVTYDGHRNATRAHVANRTNPYGLALELREHFVTFSRASAGAPNLLGALIQADGFISVRVVEPSLDELILALR